MELLVLTSESALLMSLYEKALIPPIDPHIHLVPFTLSQGFENIHKSQSVESGGQEIVGGSSNR